jgi:hypothetical protein
LAQILAFLNEQKWMQWSQKVTSSSKRPNFLSRSYPRHILYKCLMNIWKHFSIIRWYSTESDDSIVIFICFIYENDKLTFTCCFKYVFLKEWISKINIVQQCFSVIFVKTFQRGHCISRKSHTFDWTEINTDLNDEGLIWFSQCLGWYFRCIKSVQFQIFWKLLI